MRHEMGHEMSQGVTRTANRAGTDLCTIVTRDGITRIRLRKKAGLDDLLSAYEEVLAQYPDTPRMWNLTAGVDLSAADIRRLATHARTRSRSRNRLAIVTKEKVTFGLSRMFQAYRKFDFVDMQIFHCEEDALLWLQQQD